ncbi:outer membrane protein assembly factor BamB family protein [Devosia rhizoryzae]|uniref:PQQ-binding-like beta-propeller repeat protein n=1 Tax=Devosia rhizoryzae TaxID=2774137 RepID=A0ABX7C9X7_9HYPH|nr:PQQ-binding-like beta-propeller repeat protein [Devosia rhizoryzae]QQR40014.1 PQQ-binding-like beta-propeller repeat protein [Devosia rhizoryzae]
MTFKKSGGLTWASLAVVALMGTTAALANEDVLTLSADPANNVMPNITYNGQNFSQLDEINLDNVDDLQVEWTFQLGVADEAQAPPLVVGDTMFVVTPKPNRVYAIDLNEQGAIKWEFRADASNLEQVVPVACCGAQTRGANYADGKLFFQSLGGHIYALDAESGELVWDVQNTDIDNAETMVGNGLIVDDLYITGMAGGEYGVRGYVTAYNIDTGERAWRFYSTGPNEEVGITDRFKPFYDFDKVENPAESSWLEDSWRNGGGSTWGYFTYDPDLKLFYYATGNCGPWNPDYRRPWGEIDLNEDGVVQSYRSNYCASMLARDVKTGELAWALNLSPQDQWDLDEPGAPVLADIEMNGEMKKTIIRAARNGYFYVIDRATGEVLNDPWPFAYQNIFTGFDKKTGSPTYNVDTLLFTNPEDRLKYTEAGALTDAQININTEEAELYGEDEVDGPSGTEATVCPTIAARNWENDAYSPQTGLLYTSVQFGCRSMRVTEGTYSYPATETYILFEWAGEKFWLDKEGNETDVKNQLQANDPVTGKTVWSVDYVQPTQDPILATAGGLLFVGGDDKGVFRAINAENGETAWEFRTGTQASASPVTFLAPDGGQRIAFVASARPGLVAVAADADADAVNRYQREGSTLYVFKLDQD